MHYLEATAARLDPFPPQSNTSTRRAGGMWDWLSTVAQHTSLRRRRRGAVIVLSHAARGGAVRCVV